MASNSEVGALHDFVLAHREELVRRCRVKVALRPVPMPTEVEIERGIPLFLDQLVDALRQGQSSSSEIGRSAVIHGHDLLQQGFTISQVVHDYGNVCQSITELAIETGSPIALDDFRMLNGCLDDAIAAAVTQFGHERGQSARDRETVRGAERLGFFAHELRNLLNTSILAFEILKTGSVGIGGSTGDVLHRSLAALRTLIDRSLAEIRLTQDIQNPEPFAVSAFMTELTASAALAADAARVALVIPPVEDGVAIRADRQVLSAVMTNLLQNAFKFTRPRTTVTLRVVASPARVLLEVQDECGGIACEHVDDLFRSFSQRGIDRTGLGLGLAFSRWAVEANGGTIDVRNIPDVGCIFTVDLPRVPADVPGLGRERRA